MKNMFLKVLELYSGIGGMHCALKEAGIPGEIVAAVDINTVANSVYKHNFPATNVICRNIQSISPDEIKKLDFNTILMSPPCQPFTRNGKYLDQNDPRADSFTYLISILDQLESVEYILMENVKGFECSAMRNMFVEKLMECKFEYQEFLLCPSTVGVPNKRLRYYCIARRGVTHWHFKRNNDIMHNLSTDFGIPYNLESIVSATVPDSYLMPDKLLRCGKALDICYKNSNRSCCFTKAYSHYVDGTGSVFTDASPEKVKECFQKANTFQAGSEEFVKCIKELKLRFFTPKEVMCLMSFPVSYDFPTGVTTKQCYRLLGNSVNVKVIAELLKILLDY